jgi:hypothetical protein
VRASRRERRPDPAVACARRIDATERPTPAGDTVVRVGVVVFLAGLVAIVAIFVPFAIDLVRHGARYAQSARHEHGVALNLATFLTCAGLAIALYGLVRQARESRRKARA